ncbi:ferritin-like domain-containing protein [Halarcobacter sp.]|uniref:ferritin-like domain-containing protein n=1 Tax=Halarcobacter sp. TaxID=2321133 RepID=UPI003B00DE90
MPANLDEALLISQRIDVNDPQPIISQALRIAVYDECKAYEAYVRIIEKFGLVQPFVHIKESEARHYQALIFLLQKYNVEVPVNDWHLKIEAPNSFVEACELGVASEIQNIAMYDNLLTHVQEADIRDVFYQLQAHSYNNHLPAFRNCILNHYSTANDVQGFNQEQVMEKIGEYQMILEDMLNGNMDETKLTNLFSKLNLSMLSGAALGAAGVAFFNDYMNKKDKE